MCLFVGGNVYTVPGPAPPAAAPVLILCGAFGFRRILLFLLRFGVVSPFCPSFLLLLVRAHEAVVPALVVVPELVADAVESAHSKKKIYNHIRFSLPQKTKMCDWLVRILSTFLPKGKVAQGQNPEQKKSWTYARPSYGEQGKK